MPYIYGMAVPITVVETREYLARAKRLLTADDRAALVDFLAWNPTAGDLVPGTGGVRKLRVALAGRGKRGGARVIYLFHDENMPLFVLTVYGKAAKDDLTPRERNEMRKLTAAIIRAAKGRTR